MQHLPLYISIVFIVTTLFGIIMFSIAAERPKVTLFVLLGWLVLQAIVGISGFYTITARVPPRFALLIGPPLLFIVLLFTTGWGRLYLDKLDIRALTLLHIVRISVEVVLFWLCLRKVVPQVMTFEGRNFDILSGVTAPFVLYFGLVKKVIGPKVVLAWNVVCLGLLLNIIVLAVLSAPFPFQRLGFEQPNIALLYFPYIWLPCCIVPLVLLSHLVAIRQYWGHKNER